MKMLNNTIYEVLTPAGYKKFDGVSINYKHCIQIKLDNGNELKCSLDHPIFINSTDTILANNCKPGITIITRTGTAKVIDIVDIGEHECYDLINVADTAAYYTNDILSHNCFEATSSTLIDGQVIQTIKKDVINDNAAKPIRIDKIHDREINIYAEPIPNHAYVLSVDPSDGTGNDNSVILIGDVTDTKNLYIAASFGAMDIPPIELGYIAATLAQRYNYAFIVGERNGVGSGVFDTLHDIYEYENLISYGSINGKPGIMSTNKVKVNACLWAKMFTELYKKNVKCYTIDNAGKYQLSERPVTFRMNDNHIMYELEFFERKPTTSQVTYQAAKNYHDDYVMAWVWLLFTLSPEIADNYLNVRTTFMTDFKIEVPEYITLDAAQLNYSEQQGTLEERLQQYKQQQSMDYTPNNGGISEDEFYKMQQMIYGSNDELDNYGRYFR